MRRINILPLMTDHADELVRQQHELFDAGAIDSVAFSFTLVPEGVPPLDKAAECTRRFRVFQKMLRPLGIPCGILLQATWGHGWTPDEPTDFQRIVKLDGTTQYTMCPEDKRFQDYIDRAVFTAASARPDFMMLDDDTRFITGRTACFCPSHTALYNRKYRKQLTSDELREAVAHDQTTVREMDAILQESMQNYARLVRGAIDRVDPCIPCSFCLCAEDVRHAPPVARILAGQGQEVIIRINNGWYLRDSPRMLPQWLYSTARQVAALPPDITVLCEPDTCPQNRYSTPASVLRMHLLLSALEGCHGGKLWITRLGVFEPASGQAYRKTLVGNAKMIDVACALHPRWEGIRIPLPEEPPFNFPPTPIPDGWHTVLARMGIPMHFGKGTASCVALAGAQIDEATDAELNRLFQNNVLLDGSAAEALTRRGLATLCGCEARPWNLPHVSLEQLPGGQSMSTAGRYAHLRPLDPGVEIASTLHHRSYQFSDQQSELAPGTIIHRSADGATVVTIANWLGGEWFDAFGMFNETRKAQLLALFNQLAPLPVWHPDDGELFLKAGTLSDGARIIVVANFSLDIHECLAFCGPWLEAAHQISRLQGDGTWREVIFQQHGNSWLLQITLAPLDVAILRLQ